MRSESVLRPRLAAQLLSGPPAAGPLEATRHLLAVQGQDPRGARLALRVRSTTAHVADVDRALTEGRTLVITWLNRGTLHLVAREDEAFLHALTTPQLRTGNERRLRQEGVSPADAERAVALIARALSDGPLTRPQIRDLLQRADVPTANQALVHILFRATLDGLIVRGPLVAGDHAFVLVSDWLGERPRIDRDRALAELARRYLIGHGPAEDRDLAKWAQISLRDARAGFKAIASELSQQEDGMVDLRRSGSPPRLPPPRLLGPFDPLLLGWRSRDFVVGESQRLVTVNGIFRAFVLVDGRAAGTWKFSAGRVQLDLWDRQEPSVTTALEVDAAAVEAYLGTRESD